MNANEARKLAAKQLAEEQERRLREAEIRRQEQERQRAEAPARERAKAEELMQEALTTIKTTIKNHPTSHEACVRGSIMIDASAKRLTLKGWDYYPGLPSYAQQVCDRLRDLGYQIKFKHERRYPGLGGSIFKSDLRDYVYIWIYW